MWFRCLLIVTTLLRAVVPGEAQEMPADYKQVLDALGRQGDFKDGVLRVNIPRTDLKVAVDGIATPTPFGFGGWIALTRGAGAMDVMMGDLVLTEHEVNPVMSALLDQGLALRRFTIIFSSRHHAFSMCTSTAMGARPISSRN